MQYPVQPWHIDTTEFYGVIGSLRLDLVAKQLVLFANVKGAWVDFIFEDLLSGGAHDLKESLEELVSPSYQLLTKRGDVYKFTHKFVSLCWSQKPHDNYKEGMPSI